MREQAFRVAGRPWLVLATAMILLPSAPSGQLPLHSPSSVARPPADKAPPVRLPACQPLPRADRTVVHYLRPGEADTYQVRLAAGEFLLLRVRQIGVHIAASILDPRGILTLEVDYPTGAHATEPVALVAAVTGVHRLLLRASSGGPSGKYELSVARLHMATAGERERAAAVLLYAAAEHRLSRVGGASRRDVADLYAAAVRRAHLGADRWDEAVAGYRLGQVESEAGATGAALAALRRAASLFSRLNDRNQLAAACDAMGQVLRRLGHRRDARVAFERARSAARTAGDAGREAEALNELALLDQFEGDLDLALAGYAAALAGYRREGEKGGQAVVLHNLGSTFLELNQFDEARDYLMQSLALQSRLGSAGSDDLRDRTLTVLGQVDSWQGRSAGAVSYYLRALELARRAGNRWSQANILDKLGVAWLGLGRFDAALAAHQQAATILRQLGDDGRLAWVLCNLGKVRERQRRFAEASAWYRQAETTFVARQDRTGEAYLALGQARIARQAGDLETARRLLEGAIQNVESLRREVPGPVLRRSFLASRQVYFESYIDVLMELHRRQPTAGWEARAFEAAERRRARSFLDTLSEAGAGRRVRVALSILRRERAELDTAAALETTKLLHPRPGLEIEREERDLLADREMLLARPRARHERHHPEPAPLSIAQIRTRVLDRGSLLLAYSLGDERSYLWVLDRRTLHAFVLPGRADIEPLAHAASELLSSGKAAAPQGRLVLARLSDAVIGPARPLLGRARLLIVADGALHGVPFSALPEDGGGRPLLVDHEVVYLDSPSALAFQHQLLAGRTLAPHLAAVVADPVFGPSDERLGAARVAGAVPLTAELQRSASDLGLAGFRRLPQSGREAAAILSLVPAGEGLAVVGLAANRQLVESGILNGYRIVHFATHGLIHPRHSELSGLVLSLVDRHGRPRDGFLRTYDFHRLHLHADLVVLSACRTALGEEVPGEGTVGMRRSLMEAGAPRVVASLWSVMDRSTAELMRRFYRRLICDGLPPAAALRQAQLSMLGQPRWRNPQQWSAFEFAGDWRSFPLANKDDTAVSTRMSRLCMGAGQAWEE